jgi:hypothetical protein
MFSLLKKLFGPKLPAGYVDTMNNAAEMFGYPIHWDDESPNVCCLVVEMEGRRYLFVMNMGEDAVATIGVGSHIKRPNAAIRNALARQNQRFSSSGRWLVTAQIIQYVAEIPWSDLSLDCLGDAIHTMVSEVAALDQKYLAEVK